MFLVNHEPWSLLDRFHQQLSDLSYSDSDSYYSNTSTGHWRPAVDIKEEKDRFLIIADVPGVSPTDIEIMMENGVLTIKGERHSQMEDDNKTYKRVERTSGTFYRRFSMPDTADSERIEAKGNNGILEVIIPKHEKVQPRKIEVKS